MFSNRFRTRADHEYLKSTSGALIEMHQQKRTWSSILFFKGQTLTTLGETCWTCWAVGLQNHDVSPSTKGKLSVVWVFQWGPPAVQLRSCAVVWVSTDPPTVCVSAVPLSRALYSAGVSQSGWASSVAMLWCIRLAKVCLFEPKRCLGMLAGAAMIFGLKCLEAKMRLRPRSLTVYPLVIKVIYYTSPPTRFV